MNYGIVLKVLGKLLFLESALMMPSLLIALGLGEADFKAFVVTVAITATAGIAMGRIPVEKHKMKVREGLSIVTLGWVVFSVFGALPFVLSGTLNFIDAFFEVVSGFTTTGATVLTDIEVLPKGLLFWRSLTHWIGGMGILIFTVAFMPTLGSGTFHLFKAESPGPTADKIAPRMKDTAIILYTTYIVITLVQIMLLMFGGMSLYESALHTFGTVGTGGFSTRNASIGAFNTYIQVVIAIFMLLSGVNFSLYYKGFKGKWQEIFRNEELRLYLSIIALATLAVTLNLRTTVYESTGLALRDAFFQVNTIISTTGYATANFDVWPEFSKSVIFLLMFVGGSAGSTGGGIKVIRILFLFKLIRREISKIYHPRAMLPIRIGGKALSGDVNVSIASFFALYILVFLGGTVLISLEGHGLVTSASAVAATIGNIGPGFDLVGPTQTYAHFSAPAKLLLSFFMLIGRLELYTVIALIVPGQLRERVFQS